MGLLSKKLSQQSILVSLEARDKEQVIKALVESLAREGKVSDGEILYHDVMDREELASTALGFGCAVPHAHSTSVSSTCLAAAKLSQPVDFGSSDGKPVSLVFLMAGPKNDSGIHLKLLSKLARLLHDASLRDRLVSANDAQEFFNLITEKDN